MAMDERTGPPIDGELPIDPDLGYGRHEPAVLVAIALGGMAGAAARYGVSRWIPPVSGGFPWATFAVNISGSFLLGLLLALVLERYRARDSSDRCSPPACSARTRRCRRTRSRRLSS